MALDSDAWVDGMDGRDIGGKVADGREQMERKKSEGERLRELGLCSV